MLTAVAVRTAVGLAVGGRAGVRVTVGVAVAVAVAVRGAVVVGAAVAKPSPIFTKLDPSVVEEERARLGLVDESAGATV